MLENGDAGAILGAANGILVPGGFGYRGIGGKVKAINYARSQGIPFFGICLGMQCAVIEFARNVCGLDDANSTEFDAETPYPVIDLLPEQRAVEDLGGTMRLGHYTCVLQPGSWRSRAYGAESVEERHRHRYEFNNTFRQQTAGPRAADYRRLSRRQAGGDRGTAGPPLVPGLPVPPGVQVSPQQAASAVQGLYRSSFEEGRVVP